jgi:GTPase SAR1 family protein
VELANDVAAEYGRTVAFSLTDTKTKSPDLSAQTHVFLVAYSCVDAQSFDDLSNKWLKLLASFAPPAKVMLVGLKADQAADSPNAGTLDKARMIYGFIIIFSLFFCFF